MSDTGWLILATFLGPIAGAVAATGLISALMTAARARARRVEHVDASGADLFMHGVPLDEEQFRDLYAATMAELDKLPPNDKRTDQDREEQYAILRRFGALTGFSRFPMLDSADRAWAWYAQNNHYATRGLPRRRGFIIHPNT